MPSAMLAYRHLPGPPGAPAAVLLHGLGGSSLNWTDFELDIAADLDAYAIDLSGFGQSPPPRDGDMSPAGLARIVAEFIESLDAGKVHVFGNSLGGAVALQLAARRPDLVASLTMLSPALPSLRATKGNIHLPFIAVPGVGERMVPRFMRVAAEQRVKASFDGTFADSSRLPRQRWEEAFDEARMRDGLVYNADAFLRALRGLMLTYVDTGPERPWKLAEQVECPALLIYGRKDPLVDPRAAHRVTRHFRNAHVVVMNDSGHVAQMEHPERVAQAWRKLIAKQLAG